MLIKDASKKGNMTILDCIVILLASCTLTLFLLFSAGHLLNLQVFTVLPDWMISAGANLFGVLTGGILSAALLAHIRKQIYRNRPTPHYLIWVLSLSGILVLSIFFIGDKLKSLTAEIATQSKSIEFTQFTSRKDGSGSYFYAKARGNFIDEGDLSTIEIRSRKKHQLEEINEEFHEGEFDEGSEYIAVSTGGREIGKIQNHKVELLGFCRERTTDRIGLLLSSWSGAASLPDELVGMFYDHTFGKLRQYSFSQNAETDVQTSLKNTRHFICSDGQRIEPPISETASRFIPCLCDLLGKESATDTASDFANSTIGADELSDAKTFRENFPDNFFSGEPIRIREGGTRRLSHESVEDFVDLARSASKDSGYNVKHFATGMHEAYQLHYYSPEWESWGMLLARSRDEHSWHLLHLSKASSKALHMPYVVEVRSDGSVDALICIRDCLWWGENGIVNLSWRSGLAKYLREPNEEDLLLEN